MSYKNDQELKAGNEKWSGWRQWSDPKGYKKHLKDVEDYNSRQDNNSSTTTTTSESDDKKKDKKKNDKKWFPSESQKAEHKSNIYKTKAAERAARNYKPRRIKGIKPTDYKLNAPKRPSVPKLPKLNIPGGGLTISKAKKPSGLSGTINRYSPKSDYSKSYPNALPKKKGKKK